MVLRKYVFIRCGKKVISAKAEVTGSEGNLQKFIYFTKHSSVCLTFVHDICNCPFVIAIIMVLIASLTMDVVVLCDPGLHLH